MTKHDAEHEAADKLLEGFLDYTTERLTSITRYSTKKAIIRQSVMEHSGATTLIAMVFSDYLNSIGVKNDTEKVLRMAIMHDADEVVSGDIPHDAKYQQGVLSDNLRKALGELTDYNIETMLKMLDNKLMEKQYKNLFNEEKGKKTIEAKIVKLADTAEAMIYCKQEERIGNKALADVSKRTTPIFHSMLDQILESKK